MTTAPPVDRAHLSRRGVITAALAAGITVPLGLAGRAAGRGRPGRRRPVPPRPARADRAVPRRHGAAAPRRPLTPGSRRRPGHHRELMASVWYPARDAARYPRAPLAGRRGAARAPGGRRLPRRRRRRRRSPPGTWARRCTTGRCACPSSCTRTARTTTAATTPIMVQELASHGYAVVTVDHTYDAFTEFPDGRVAVPIRPTSPWAPRDFAADLRVRPRLRRGARRRAQPRRRRQAAAGRPASAPSTRGASACSARRRAARRPPSPCASTGASGPG